MNAQSLECHNAQRARPMAFDCDQSVQAMPGINDHIPAHCLMHFECKMKRTAKSRVHCPNDLKLFFLK